MYTCLSAKNQLFSDTTQDSSALTLTHKLTCLSERPEPVRTHQNGDAAVLWSCLIGWSISAVEENKQLASQSQLTIINNIGRNDT